MLAFAILVLAGLAASLFVPRRRLWLKVRRGSDGELSVEYAGLARGDDPRLDEAVQEFAARHSELLGGAAQTGDAGAGAGKRDHRG